MKSGYLATNERDVQVVATGETHRRLRHVPEIGQFAGLRANREFLLAALGNRLRNAFKFTRANSDVAMTAYAFGELVLIEVTDLISAHRPTLAGSARKAR